MRERERKILEWTEEREDETERVREQMRAKESGNGIKQDCPSRKTTSSGQERRRKDFEERTKVCRRKQEKKFRKKGREEERTSKEKLEMKKGIREEGVSWKHNSTDQERSRGREKKIG